jgi:hypothetical protein
MRATMLLASRAISKLDAAGLERQYNDIPLDARNATSDQIKEKAARVIDALRSADQSPQALKTACSEVQAAGTLINDSDLDAPLKQAGLVVVKALVDGAWTVKSSTATAIAAYKDLPQRVKGEGTSVLILGLRVDADALDTVQAIGGTVDKAQSHVAVAHGLDDSGNTIELYTSSLNQLSTIHTSVTSDAVREATAGMYTGDEAHHRQCRKPR